MTTRLLPALAAALLAACSGTEGELGGGAFLYACATDQDGACGPERLSRLSSVPTHLAVGAPFGLAYESHETLGPIFLAAASSQTLELRGGVGRLLVPGPSTVLARTPEGRVVDMLHLEAAPIAGIEVTPMRRSRTVDADGELFVPDGAPVEAVVLASCAGACGTPTRATFLVRPLDEQGRVLAGSVEFRWSVVGGDAVRVLDAGEILVATLEAQAPGEATLRIEAHGFVKELPVRVLP